MIEQFKIIAQNASDEKFNETISRGILRLSDNQINTVSFVFWLCYLAETDLNDVVKGSWQKVSSNSSDILKDKALEILVKKMYNGKKDKKIDFNNLEYFIDKIKVYEMAVGKNKSVEMLWIINGIRNDLSHNRINELQYKKESLFLRETKNKLLIDYFQAFKK